MDKKTKEVIQEALKAELRKEGIWDAWENTKDAVAGIGQGIANIPRGIAGQFQLGSVNKKLDRAAQRIDKTWTDAENHTIGKARKMRQSKNPQVASMGTEVQRNVEQIDRTVKATIQKIQALTNLGADKAGAATQEGFHGWLEKFGYDLDQGSKAEYSRLFSMYIDLVQKGIDPHKVDPAEWAERSAGKDYSDVINLAKQAGLQGAENLRAPGSEESIQSGSPKRGRAQAQIPPSPTGTNGDIATQFRHVIEQLKQSGYEPTEEDKKGILNNIVSRMRQAQGQAQGQLQQAQIPQQPQQAQTSQPPPTEQSAPDRTGRMRIPISQVDSSKKFAKKKGLKVDQSKKVQKDPTSLQASERSVGQRPVDEISHGQKLRSYQKPSGVSKAKSFLKKGAKGLGNLAQQSFKDYMKSGGGIEGDSLTDYEEESPVETQAPEVQEFDLPPREIEDESPGTLSSMYGMDDEEEPMPLTKKKLTLPKNQRQHHQIAKVPQSTETPREQLKSSSQESEQSSKDPELNMSNLLPTGGTAPKLPKKIVTDENGEETMQIGDVGQSGTSLRPDTNVDPEKKPESSTPKRKRKIPSARR